MSHSLVSVLIYGGKVKYFKIGITLYQVLAAFKFHEIFVSVLIIKTLFSEFFFFVKLLYWGIIIDPKASI